MKVFKYEVSDKKGFSAICYNSAEDTLQFSKEIFNELDTMERDTYIDQYVYFQYEMEKIDSGDTSNLSSVKYDEYLGSVGLPTEIEVEARQRKLYGVC